MVADLVPVDRLGELSSILKSTLPVSPYWAFGRVSVHCELHDIAELTAPDVDEVLFVHITV